MEENKSKGKGLSIAMIILVVFLGFGFVIGLTQTSALQDINKEKAEISNYSFSEDGVLQAYSGTLTELVIPATYSYANKTERVEMSSSSLNSLVDRVRNMGIQEFKVENQTGNFEDEYGNVYYQEKYVVTYTKKEVVEGTDYQVTAIGANAFANNSRITKVVIPDTVKRINSSAFIGCTRLETVEFSENLERIENSAFYNCIRLKNVTLPNSITYIGSQAFSECDALTTINIPTSMTTITDNTFSYCDGLTSITIPSNIRSIYSNAFYYCRNLRTVNFEEGLDYISSSAFYYCRGLTSITLPSTITQIGNQAFWNCTALRTVIIKAPYPPYIESNTLQISYITAIYVPDEAYEDYIYYGSMYANYSEKMRPMSEYRG